MIRLIFLISLTFLTTQGFPLGSQVVVDNDLIDAEIEGWNLDNVMFDGPSYEEQQENIQSMADIKWAAGFQKFRALPEVTKLVGYAKKHGIDLMDLLLKLEKFMQTGGGGSGKTVGMVNAPPINSPSSVSCTTRCSIGPSYENCNSRCTIT